MCNRNLIKKTVEGGTPQVPALEPKCKT